MQEHVFGYGSLVALPGGVPCVLRGHRRWWGVAMDNREVIPGYKRYKDADGAFPDVFVAYLDVEPDAGAAVNGACLPVDAAEVAALDERERNYSRVDVTDLIEGGPPGRVHTYVGLAASRERLATARERGLAVVDRTYVRAVRRAFKALGPDQLERFDASTLPHGLEEAPLRKVAVPERTADGHHVVIDGRRWRATDPSLPEARRQELVNELMAARRAVGAAKRTQDAEAERAARARVHAAKVALGERGPKWWERPA